MTHARAVVARTAGALAVLVALVALGACSSEPQGANADPSLVDSTEVPELGTCRVLTPDDVAQPANATRTVPCTERHTAETFAVGELPDELDDAAYDDQAVGRYAYETCSTRFAEFVGADESLVLRTMVSWAWFRPSEKAWDEGARWYRCDIVGGNGASETYRPLPQTAKGLLAGRPADKWMVCAAGRTVTEGDKVPCSQPHDWRAATTIKLGEPDDAYPGDQVVASRTKSFCSTSIEAWLNYPARFEFAYTHFHRAEWEAGNRRSVCWARTSD
ncbi:septum formation family protein [Nocardioides sp. TF02-7]|uniref:septum formation family protein n=1 Tax=Nocardioides sp. TF02-7 TaxID=2917724 RepID=UPI001F053E08|nr:septum formation family protein [Nocardioides sp. TF02-7]UMG92901.1 septum formation family protein [Nocardioides sp. TF02-7]